MSASQNIENSKIIEVVALALKHKVSAAYMLARRSVGQSGAGQWEFPGGKIETGETQSQALSREIHEELNFNVNVVFPNYFAEHVFTYPNKKIRLYLWLAEIDYMPEFRLVDHDSVGWFTLQEIEKINLSAGDKYFISLLKELI